MSENYSSDGYNNYSDYSDNQSEEQSHISEKRTETNQSRVQFSQDSTINMQVGATGTVQIIPGPNKTFSISFTINNDPNQSLSLSIADGVCKVNAENALIQPSNFSLQPQAEQQVNERDPSLLYGYKKL
ncbi:hypothetical protein SS50377_25490 [Spironucleus salmonicida]|uniref:Uncharacterized protein n=1 Tax=Spironucleus salmonicida TaxID=348837 RepID=V6LKE2_9EUKA|nr:hypothetical protein SS50377_25490 [Spironucleus salmonicida]|eukprot:EST45037.1 Hypothetical protein SS50377_15056 [Spironucleus salmonicida]